jgi:hypothetical protein
MWKSTEKLSIHAAMRRESPSTIYMYLQKKKENFPVWEWISDDRD